MAYRPTLDAERALQAIAAGQGGYFTTVQAARAGYRSPHLAYHVRTGRMQRAGHGVYRLTTLAASDHDDLVRLSLWSRNRADEPQAVVSHVTALVVHGITNLLPSQVHLTVPRGFKKAKPVGCVLHRAALGPSDWEQRTGFRVTTVLRTLLDVADAPDVPALEFESSVHQALETGLVRKGALVAAAGASARLRDALARIEEHAR